MKYILGLLLTINVAWAIPFNSQQIINTYIKILIASHSKSAPKLRVIASPIVNAWRSGNTITITTGMIRYAKSIDEVALILGHELGHYILNHTESRPSAEYAADKLGAKYMKSSGFNLCKGAQFFARINDPDSDSHPASIKRVHKFGCTPERYAFDSDVEFLYNFVLSRMYL